MSTTRCSFAATCGGTCADAWAAAAETGHRAVRRLDPATARDAAIVRRPQRAPLALHSSTGVLPISLSMSHTRGAVAAAAVHGGWKVGVDIERIGRAAADEARFCLTDREQPYLATLGATALWCLKEAAWKALECGPDVPFRAPWCWRPRRSC